MKKNPKILFSIIILFLTLSHECVFAQFDSNSKIGKIFSEFENGIRTGAIKEFSNNLISETYISLENGESSYYSSNQSFYILKDFFQNYIPISFKIIKTSINEEKPFAIGKLVYSKNGIRGESQVFIALKLENENWKISQIIIN
ncbi:MAG: hypothetical protein COW71_12795 [Ignavibacteriales bacterium CG18_big_fil_WC_8_21_14_2_50_31_20]|nr:MAG: hypothetical protein COW71_12795 [Ignavibacteriales bacterium CG18_big_fil_WC_8_21_14_2_50_31_20]